MPAPPFAQVQASINGAANASGGLSAGFTQTVALSAVSTVGWTAAIWEIYEFPPGFTAPAGWTTAPTGVITFQPSNPTTPPPSFSLPATGTNTWGKFATRLRINGNPLQFNADGSPNTGFRTNLTDQATTIRISSPNLGMHGVFLGESIQFDVFRAAVGELMQMFRAIDGGGTPGGGFIPPTGTGLVTVTAGTLNPTVQTLTAHAVLLGEGSATLGFATIGTAGRYLRDNGAGVDPSFAQVAFSELSGAPTIPTLPTLANHAIVTGQGTTTPLFLLPGTAGNVATSNGTDWVSQAPTAVGVGTPGSVITANTSLGPSNRWQLIAPNAQTLTWTVAPTAGVEYLFTTAAGGAFANTFTGAGQVTMSAGSLGFTIVDPQNNLATPASSVTLRTDNITYRFILDSGANVLRCVN